MGKIVRLKPGKKASRETDTGSEARSDAEVIMFTGVRYSRGRGSGTPTGKSGSRRRNV